MYNEIGILASISYLHIMDLAYKSYYGWESHVEDSEMAPDSAKIQNQNSIFGRRVMWWVMEISATLKYLHFIDQSGPCRNQKDPGEGL